MSAVPETPAAPSRPTVTEREARQVAEAAREQDWRKPSFAKELFLGRFRPDLIHPTPSPPTRTSGAARSSWPSCATSARRGSTAP